MISRSSLLVAVSFASLSAVIVACGDSGTSTSGSGGSGGDTSVSSSSTGSNAACDAFHDQSTSATAITFTLHNAGSVPFSVPNETCNSRFSVDGVAAEKGDGVSCDALIAGSPPADACTDTSFTVVQPGASLSIDWKGTVAKPQSMTAACVSTDANVSCAKAAIVVDGAHTATFRVNDGDCSDPKSQSCGGLLAVSKDITVPFSGTVTVDVATK